MIIGHVSCIGSEGNGGSQVAVKKCPKSQVNSFQSARMDHHIFSKGEWKRAKLINQSTWKVRVSVCGSDYKEFSRPCPDVRNFSLDAKLDTCA